MIFYDSSIFLMFSDESLIHKVNVKLMKYICFLLFLISVFIDLSIWKSAYISKNILAIKTECIWWKPNSPEPFIEKLIVFMQLFMAEIYGFYVFADISIWKKSDTQNQNHKKESTLPP